MRRLPPGRDLGAVPAQRQRLLHHLRGGHGRRSGRRAAGLCTASLLSGFFFLGNASELIDPIYSILYFSFINCLWDGIMDPQVSSSFLLLDFSSTNSLRGGITQKFPFSFFPGVHCLPKWTNSMSIPQVFEQSPFLFPHRTTLAAAW